MHHNALSKETSPYLLQHAHNPVAWYPWGGEALEMARSQYKPILLSIGYSACHWCHVMAHESFEDEETATLMNELFINIKVDREERPDLDRIYQSAHQLLTQRAGGWPLTLFLDPDDQTPFFAGTYFPKNRSHGMPAFKELLTIIAENYRSHRTEIQQQGAVLIRALAQMDEVSSNEQVVINPTLLDRAREQLQDSFDEIHGGFGSAPKFPHSTQLEYLLGRHAIAAAKGEADRAAWQMVEHTLSKMALGGIYDQLGGGFCRYSVDDRWMIPHFEKMLYDNGPLLSLYSEAWQVGRDGLFQRIAHETAHWVCREMQSPEGGYYSSLDADSEGEEGKYYIWSREEVGDLLSPEEYELFSRRFGLDRLANFEGQWHLHVYQSLDELAEVSGNPAERVEGLLESAQAKLFARRKTRVRPGRDEKILTSWNALMIKGMATAGRIFEKPEWINSAEQALDFIQQTLWRDGRLLATYKDGKAHLAAYLDDYAYLMDALFALLMARWRDSDLRFLIQLADVLLHAFEDREQGGFYFTAHDHEMLIHRPKPLADDAMPAGNGIAAHALLHLGHLLGEQRYLDAAERALAAAWPSMEQLPYAHGALLNALEAYLSPPQMVVLRGNADELKPWLALCNVGYRPNRLALAIPADAGNLPGLLEQRAPAEGPIAYLCEGFHCELPITNLSDLEIALANP